MFIPGDDDEWKGVDKVVRDVIQTIASTFRGTDDDKGSTTDKDTTTNTNGTTTDRNGTSKGTKRSEIICRACCCNKNCLVCEKEVPEGRGYHVSYGWGSDGKSGSLLCGKCKLVDVPKAYTGCIMCGMRGSRQLVTFRRTVAFFCGTANCRRSLEMTRESDKVDRNTTSSEANRIVKGRKPLTTWLNTSWGRIRHCQPEWCAKCGDVVRYQDRSTAFLFSLHRQSLRDYPNILYVRCKRCTGNELKNTNCVGCEAAGTWTVIDDTTMKLCGNEKCERRGQELIRLILERKDRCRSCRTPLDVPQRCSRCRTAPYCGRECQERDWTSHSPGCTEVHVPPPSLPI